MRKQAGKATEDKMVSKKSRGRNAAAKNKKPATTKKSSAKRTMMPGMTSARMPMIKGAEGISKDGVYSEGGEVTIARGSGAARPQNFRKNG